MDPFRTPDAVEIGSATGITAVEKLAGIDTLVWEGTRLIVRSPRAMPSWRVGTNRKTAVHFRGARYAVVQARMEQQQFEYVLDPWPERAHDRPSQEITYDEPYVRDREEYARAFSIRRSERLVVAPLWPLFGFFPSSLKRTLHARYGFSPLTATRFSVWIELALLPGLMIFLFVGLGGPLQLSLFVGCFVDSFFRASILVDDDYPPFGVGEWIVQRQLFSVVRQGVSAIRARLRGPRDGPRD